MPSVKCLCGAADAALFVSNGSNRSGNRALNKGMVVSSIPPSSMRILARQLGNLCNSCLYTGKTHPHRRNPKKMETNTQKRWDVHTIRDEYRLTLYVCWC